MQKRACFDHIWKRALGNGDKAVAIVSLLKTARAIEKESLEIRNFIKSQIAIGRLSKKLGSSDQIMTIWARSTNEFADPFTPEAATLISEVILPCSKGENSFPYCTLLASPPSLRLSSPVLDFRGDAGHSSCLTSLEHNTQHKYKTQTQCNARQLS